jgi:hypothetical protein
MQNEDEILSKVPGVTIGFWVNKILYDARGDRRRCSDNDLVARRRTSSQRRIFDRHRNISCLVRCGRGRPNPDENVQPLDRTASRIRRSRAGPMTLRWTPRSLRRIFVPDTRESRIKPPNPMAPPSPGSDMGTIEGPAHFRRCHFASRIRCGSSQRPR